MKKILSRHYQFQLDVAVFFVEYIIRLVFQVHVINDFIFNAQSICDFGKFAVHQIRARDFIAVRNAKDDTGEIIAGQPNEFHFVIAVLIVLKIDFETTLFQKPCTDVPDRSKIQDPLTVFGND